MAEEVNEFMEYYLAGLISDHELDYVFEAYAGSRNCQQRVRSNKGAFNLNSMEDEEVFINFRFHREDLERLQSALNIPNVVEPPPRYRITGQTALCVLLRRLAYPNRLTDLENMFGLSSPALSATANYLIKYLEGHKGYLLYNLKNVKYINQQLQIEKFCNAIRDKGAPLLNCWGFIDGTARRICRPSVNQELYFSGHKRFHCVKYQSIMAPDGIIVSLHGAYPGRRHDAGMYAESEIYPQLKAMSRLSNYHKNYVIYGDPAYPISDVLINPYRGGRLSEQEQIFNTSMSAVRQSVEWGFQKVCTDFAFCDYHKNQKLMLQGISNMYKVCILLSNCHTCLYGSQTGSYFNLEPPLLEEYLA